MRPIAVLLGVVLLVVAGCSDDDAPAEPAATTTQVPATTQPAAESTTSSSSAEEAVEASVVYEPGNCTYLGPAVIPRGTKATFEFDDGGHAVLFVVGLAIDGTTREEIIEYSETRGGPDAPALATPYYAAGPVHYQHAAGLLVAEFRYGGDRSVECLTQDSTNRRYLGGIIKVIAESTTSPSSAETAVDATVVYEPGNCTYLGPAVIPLGSTVTFEFDDGGHAVFFIVGLVIDGITREEIIEYDETRSGPNAGPVVEPYYSAGLFYYQRGAGSLVLEFRDDGDWTVECFTPPDLPNRAYLGGIIQVIEG